MWSNRIASWFIFLIVVSFFNLSAKYITFKIAMGFSYQDISTASKSTPLKAHASFFLSSFSLFKKCNIKTRRKYLCSSKGKCVNFIYWFFLSFSIWQILMLEQKGKIQSTLESTKQWTGRIVRIFIPLVSFLNLLENISLQKSNGCIYKHISTASKSAPLKAPLSFSLSKFGYSFPLLSWPKRMKALER